MDEKIIAYVGSKLKLSGGGEAIERFDWQRLKLGQLAAVPAILDMNMRMRVVR